MAAVSWYMETIHPRVTPSAERSLPICGSATVSAATENGARKALSVAAIRTGLLASASIQLTPVTGEATKFEDTKDAASWFDALQMAESDKLKIARTNAIKLFKLDLK